MKLSESSYSKTEDPKTPPKENKKEQDDIDDDFLDVANDVNFEDEDDTIGKRSSKAKSEEKEKPIEDEADKTLSDKLNASVASNSDERSRRARSEKSVSKEGERSVDLNCIHCLTKCSSLDVSFKTRSQRRSG